MDRLTEAVAFHAARLTRRILTHICHRSVTAEIYLQAAGVDVDRLGAEHRQREAKRRRAVELEVLHSPVA